MNSIYKIIFVALLAAISLPASAAIFGYDDYWDCILGEMPDVQNDIAANAVISECTRKYPQMTVKKKRSSFLGSNQSKCIQKYAKNTSSRIAAVQIAWACRQLYDR